MHLPAMTDYEKTCREVRFDLPEHYNFGFDLIDERARRADKTACVAVSADGTAARALRFSDLARSSARFANVLRALGAVRGDLAYVMIARIPAWYDVVIGCAKAGVVAMPATNLLTPKDVEYRVNAARARFAIVTDDNAGKVDAIRAACPSLERCIVVPRPGGSGRGGDAGAGAGTGTGAGAGTDPRPDWIDFDEAMAGAPDTFEPDRPTRSRDPMLVYFTSGTTSLPKMVPRDHGYALAHVLTGRYWMDLREDDVHWTLSDTGWAKAAWGVLFAPWQMGAAIVLHDAPPGFDVDLHLRIIGRLGVTTFCAPPTAYRRFAQVDLERYDLGSLRHSLGAGEPLNPEVIKVWEAATGTVIRDGYGQTETINVLANYPALAVRPGSMGKPVPGFDVDVVDDGGRRLAPGEVGHIAVRTVGAPPPPGLFDGYAGAPEANAKAFRHGWYYTGDTATRDEDGYFWFVGRADDLIGSAGYRISPFEVESALLEHPAVAESAVVGRPDEIRGEIVKAFVVLARGHEPSPALAAEIQDFVKELTAPYKYPREIEFRASLPKTVSGKIRRVELRATEGS